MKAAIFDMDGTVLDSMHMWNTVLPELLSRLNIEEDDKFISDTHSMSLDQMVPYVIKRYSLPMTEKELRRQWKDEILKRYIEDTKPKAHIEELLESFKKKGIRMSIATLTDHELCDRVLEAKGLSEYFDFILTTEDVSMVGKEHPDLFLKCAASMGAKPEECVVFEDSLYPIPAAKKAGFTVFVIEESSMIRHKERLTSLSDRYIRDFRELL